MIDRDSPRPVVIAGWVGSNNLGDELIHRAMVRELRALGYSPTSLSRDPVRTEALHGTASFRFAHLWTHLATARGMIFGGGTLIQQDSSLLNTTVHLQRLRLARLRHVPTVAAGLGVGEIRTRGAASGVRREFAQLKAIAVRDHDSKATLEGLGIANVEVGCDLVFTETPPATEPDDVIAVGLRPPLAGGLIPTSLRQKTHTDRWLLAMAAGLDNAASATGLGIRFIAMDRVRDHAVHEAVAARMRSDAQFDVPDLGSVLTSFGTARVAVGMRYHAAVASLVAGRPAVGLAYSQKVASLTDEAGGAVVSSSLSLDALDDLPAAVTQALAHSYRVSDAVAHQRSRMRVVRDVLARVAA